MFEKRDPHLNQLESHKQDSSDVPIKSNRGSINQEIGMAKGLVHHAQSITPQKWHLATRRLFWDGHCNFERCWMTRTTTPDLSPPLRTSSPHQWEDVWPTTHDLMCKRPAYTADRQLDGVSNLEPSDLQAETLPQATADQEK
ncbi:hypothetical protein AVEN_50344-1 [Araneus ventricosus]|uniref:Uncharacterized protein n=1 Tax=Araneus ventricosus TaxID=182803 RepID=A0A4Y2E7X0_ARAVE|nr:hypothetical protein AVEN_50344-1 [Araneus ventricosus]